MAAPRGWQGWDGSSLGAPRAGDGQTDLCDCELEPCVAGPGPIPVQSIPAHSLPEQCRDPGRENSFSPFLNTALGFFFCFVFFFWVWFFWVFLVVFLLSLVFLVHVWGFFFVCVCVPQRTKVK